MEEVRQQAYPDLVLTGRQLCDVELLLNGGFNPLDGFLNKKDTESVYDNYRLANGMLWPMPINLDVATETGKQLASSPQGSVALRDQEGNLIAVMDLNDAWEVDKEREAKAVFGGDPEHPAIRYLYNQAGDMYLGGQLRGYQLPPHYDYTSMRQTPAELRAQFDEMGWTGKPVVAFQTRNPMHRAHVELVKSAAEKHNANILIHPVVGMTKPGGELFMFLHLSIKKYIYKVFILHSITLFMDSFFFLSFTILKMLIIIQELNVFVLSSIMVIWKVLVQVDVQCLFFH
jgi:sulfate adenylyltransferase